MATVVGHVCHRPLPWYSRILILSRVTPVLCGGLAQRSSQSGRLEEAMLSEIADVRVMLWLLR